MARLDHRRHSQEVARRLYEARIELGITMQAVADALGRTRQQIEYWESGRACLSLPLLLEWALALGLKLTLVSKELVTFETNLQDPTMDSRFLSAFRAADQRTRDVIALLLAIDRPLPRPIELGLPVGRPSGPGKSRVRSLSAEELDELRNSPVPMTGNKLIIAMRLTNARIPHVAAAANVSDKRVATVVRGKAKAISLAHAEMIASCFGCAVADLFPTGRTVPETVRSVESPAQPTTAVPTSQPPSDEGVWAAADTGELATS
jgi:transcriptional regulator with XRE-family HTH domain